MAYLWLTSYISIPFSNLCWLFAKGNFHGPTLSFLYPLLPSFLMPANPHASIHNDLRIIDGASTYLAAYALDFSYLGCVSREPDTGHGMRLAEWSALCRRTSWWLACFLPAFRSFFSATCLRRYRRFCSLRFKAWCSGSASIGASTARERHGARMSEVQPVFAEATCRLTVTAVIVLYRMEPE